MSNSDFSNAYVEQDHNIPKDGDELPTYDDLAEQGGPNSRFGRWRGWIEKRAAERYADITPEIRQQRRERGWGNDDPQPITTSQPDIRVPEIINAPPTPTAMSSLQIQTNNLNFDESAQSFPSEQSPLPPLPFVSRRIRPTHLKVNHFGSRFLPHSTAPIRCLLPLQSNRLLLIGTEEGLSVLDMYPQEWTDGGHINVKGPDEAQARVIWTGEAVYQLNLLEVEENAQGATPTGVVLALVGPDSATPSGKDSETTRTLRMYNLASLTSLAKWAVASKGARPLDLSRPSNWQAQQSPSHSKRHKASGSFAKGLRSLIDSPKDDPHHSSHSHSYHRLLSPSSSVLESGSSRKSPSRSASPGGRQDMSRQDMSRQSSNDSWDMVDDLPLRWATDFVPLATANSRLTHAAVISYALWVDDQRRGIGGQLLAVATKTNILLYETPRGERAFRFVKEFYTPLQPRNVTFFQQSVQDAPRASEASSSKFSHHRKRSSGQSPVDHDLPGPSISSYSPQLGLFVIFDKKAGWIRLADAAVGEIEMFDDGTSSITSHSLGHHAPRQSSLGAGSLTGSRSSRISLDSTFSSSMMNKWIPPFRIELPVPQNRAVGLPSAGPSTVRKVYIITRGQVSHILPCPLPSNSWYFPPLKVIKWRGAPASISARVCDPTDYDGSPPFLQIAAFGDVGVEVQEHGLSFLIKGGGDSKGKGKAPASPIEAGSLTGIEDLGGNAGYLCPGGHWDNPHLSYHLPSLTRSYSASSALSYESYESQDLLAKMKREEGMYGWVRKGLEDWRIFWVGGSLDIEDDDVGPYEDDEDDI